MAYEDIKLKSETGRCLLCHNASCSVNCPNNIPVADIIRSVRFENKYGAAEKLGKECKCENCNAPCKEVCNRGKIDKPIDIPEIMKMVSKDKGHESGRVDLSVDFCGVHFENPFLLSSSVVGSNYEMVAKAFEMGWAGVAFKTIGLFIPNEVSPRFAALEKEENPFIGFKNIEQTSDHSIEENIDFLKRLKKDYPSKIIVASIMGQTEEEWTELAALMEQAGADIIECNFSCPQMVGEGLGSDVGTNLELVRKYTAATRKGTKLPILAKMTPNITRMEEPATAAMEAGADGLAAINTIKSIMNVNPQNLASAPSVVGKSSIGGYSGKSVKPIALRFIHDMKKAPRTANAPISGMGGIETWKDAMEFIALGCGTVQVTTAVMQYGYRIIDDMIDGLSTYLASKGYASVDELIGAALDNVIDPGALDRSTIEFPKFDRDACVKCGRCFLSCYDGGHQAIEINPETGAPTLIPSKCVGCQLCTLVCPARAIKPSEVRISKERLKER